MDYIEILSYCAFDVLKAHEIAKEHGVKPFSETIKELEQEEVTENADDE